MDGVNLNVEVAEACPAPAAVPALARLLAVVKFLGRFRPSKLVRQILFGCFCSVLVSVVVNLPYLKMVVLWICQIILLIFGNPDLPEPLKKAKDEFHQVVVKGRELAGQTADGGGDLRPIAALRSFKKKHEARFESEAGETLTRVVPVGKTAAKVKQSMIAAKEKVEQKIVETGGAVKQGARQAAHEVGQKIDGLGAALRGRREEAQKRAAEAERAQIIHRAAALHIPWKDRPLEQVRDDVIAAEAKRAPNAQCPYCSQPLRVNRHATGERRCPKCGEIYSARAARQLGPPLRGRMIGNPLFRR